MISKTGANRYNDTKDKWSLVDFKALRSMVKVLEYGVGKYDAHNWKKGLPYTDTMESMLRHIYAFLDGEDIDPESGLPHTGHIMCNAMFLSYYYEYMKNMDDRYKHEIQKEKRATCEQESS